MSDSKKWKERREYMKIIRVPFVHYKYLSHLIPEEDAYKMLNRSSRQTRLMIGDLQVIEPLKPMKGFFISEDGKRYISKEDFIKLHHYAYESFQHCRNRYDKKAHFNGK